MTTLNLQVGAGGDDFIHFQDNGTHTFDAAGINLFHGYAASTAKRGQSGMRYTSVTIGNGDTIDAATTVYRARNTNSNADVVVHIRADDADNPAAPTNDAGWDALTDTTADVSWTMPSFVAGNDFTTPDFKSVIQGLVNRGGWSSGNAMIILIGDRDAESTATDGTRRDAQSYEGESANAPKLDIDYTAAAGGVTVLAALATATALSPAATIMTGLLVAASLATATALVYAAKNVNTISAKVATAVAVSPASAVSGAALIAANLATATAKSFAASIITAGSITVSAALATASALSYAAKHVNTIPAAVSTATAASLAATVSGAAVIAGAVATATARSWDATVSGAALVAGALSTATARSWAAAINPGVTIAGALATATALAPKATLVIEGVTGAVRRLAYYPVSLVSTRFRRRGRR
ncbi:hypothetical protein LCGC14_0889030 [marine sediment metagenome]|uniref:Uncharacterized protein n=1 Tax=marine sediment metagenome TaxID=412755 RepID=A0A0F9RJ29_9ZZZZ